MVLPDVDETAGCQVYLVRQELQQLYPVVQTQRTEKKKKKKSMLRTIMICFMFRKKAELNQVLTFGW